MSSERSTSEDMWTPYKELQHIVETVVSGPSDGVLKRVEGVLKKHKQNFINLLKNPPKNAKSREELRKGTTNGIDLPGLGHQILSKELVDEAIIISDMYDLNEYVALDLLCTAQQQMPYHPGLTRGLVAVLLYYDGRKAIAATLRALVQARRGFSWTLETTEEIVTFITKYTQELMDSGLINKILELLQEMDLSKEVEMLQENRALGGPKHHHQVVDLFQNIRQILADVVYFWAAQSGLPKEPTFKLINYIKNTKLQEEATGGIDGVTLALEMALLYALDLSIVQRREDGEQVVQKLPLLSEPDFMNALLKELYPSERQWECVGLQMLTNLAWGLALATMRFLPSSMIPREEGITDEDEVLVDSAIEMNVFDFLRCTILENQSLYKEEFYVRRLHTLLTDFIVLMPAKLKELRNGAEDSSRTMQVYAHEGIEPPSSLPRHYEHFMLAIARLYKGAGSHQSNELVLDYWGAIDGTSSGTFARSSSRQAALFKFICGGADMLQPMVFVSYMRMLCSLVCHPVAARHAFNLLKQNMLGSCVSISWDHFFQSLNRYYTNLRQELPPSTDTVYRHRSYPRGITPQEIQGLQAVLAVIRAVADQDEMARLALCENPNWASLTILLGLVSCSVPIPLKAELLLTLAALAKSPDTASALWHNLEASQILTTVPSTSSYQPRGIQTELEEIESRNEEFPLTRALLHLLNVLTDMPIPRLLGVGTRTPGFDPYLNFVINSVFLRFNNRSYKHTDEKWLVAKSCLQLLAKLLTQYEPRTEDFVGNRVELQGGGMTQVNPPPGYHIMVQLNTKSELLHLVLYLLDESCRLLDTYSIFAGKEALEESMLSCLELLDRGLILQQKFFGFLSSSGSSLLLTGLNKLLLGVNPRSGKPDHLLNVAKFVTYNTWLPRQSFAAVRILISETLYPPSHTQILGAFTSTTATKMEIRHGFVECLEAQDDEIVQGEDLEVEEMGVICRTKEAIYKLMQQCLSHSPPNLSHYLLGFDINKDIKKTVFQQPGVMGFPRTCLHSLLGMLDTACQARKGSFFLLPKPRLLDAGYCMLYSLCANNKTSEPVLRFLRSSDFLARHLDSLPFTKDTTQSLELNQMAWLLKTAAIELKVTSTNMHQSQLAKLVELLIHEYSANQDVLEDEPGPLSRTDLASNLELAQMLSVSDSLMMITNKQMSRILLLINFVKFSVERVTPPNWEFFDPAQIDQVLVQCETGGSGKSKLIDVKKLHRILVEELSAIQGSSTAGQRQLIVQEIQAVLRYALKLNSHRSIVGSTVHYVDAWRQMTEVLFAVCPPEVLSFEIRKHLILGAIRLLLDKVLQTDSLVELASLSSGVLLLLMVNLRHCLAMERKEVKYRQQKDQLMISGATSGNTSEKDENEISYLQAKIAVFKIILVNMLEWIVKSGVGSQQLRANLYGALLNFLHIVCESSKSDTEEEAMNEDLEDAYENQLDSTIYSINQKSNKEFQASVDIIVSFGERLMDVLCHDCIGGHDVCKMLALSCLDMVLEIDPHTSWFTYLSSRGYLKHIIDSLMDADDKLIALLDDVPATLRPLYLYESKMALLCRIASSHSGAELLLEHGTLSCISSMAVFSHHPQIQVSLARSSMNMETDFVPSITSRYLQIVFPALDLCHALLTALGTDNQSCTVQIMQFMISHSDMVTMVLHTGSPFNQLCDLQELAKLTGVIARASRQDLCHISTTEPGLEKSSQLLRIQKLMLSLLPRFIVSESLIRELSYSQSSHERSARTVIAQQEHNATPKEDKLQSILCFFQVAGNLLLYVRNILSSRSTDQRISTVVFKPSIVDYAVAAEGRNKEYHVLGEGTVLGLGVVIQQLIQCVEHYHREKAALDILSRKLASVPNMNIAEFKEYLPESSQVGNIASSRLQAAHHIIQCINHKQEELEYCSFLVENCLYLIWCHLDFYMLRALPPRAFGLTGSANFQTELTWNVTAKDISTLKQGLVSVFTDSLSKKLVEIKQDHGSTEKGFVEVLLRRIKRLIQFVPVK